MIATNKKCSQFENSEDCSENNKLHKTAQVFKNDMP